MKNDRSVNTVLGVLDYIVKCQPYVCSTMVVMIFEFDAEFERAGVPIFRLRLVETRKTMVTDRFTVSSRSDGNLKLLITNQIRLRQYCGFCGFSIYHQHGHSGSHSLVRDLVGRKICSYCRD